MTFYSDDTKMFIDMSIVSKDVPKPLRKTVKTTLKQFYHNKIEKQKQNTTKHLFTQKANIQIINSDQEDPNAKE